MSTATAFKKLANKKPEDRKSEIFWDNAKQQAYNGRYEYLTLETDAAFIERIKAEGESKGFKVSVVCNQLPGHANKILRVSWD